MGVWSSLNNVAKSLASSAIPKEEPIEKPIQIMLVKEPARSKRQQLHDMVNLNRDTDGVLRTKQKLREVNKGTAFDTKLFVDYSIRTPKSIDYSTYIKKTKGKKNNNPWSVKI